MTELLERLAACPYLENACLNEAEGRAPLLRMTGGRLSRKTDGTAVYSLNLQAEVFENANEICLWLLKSCPGIREVSAPRVTGGETGIRYLIDFCMETEAENGQG